MLKYILGYSALTGTACLASYYKIESEDVGVFKPVDESEVISYWLYFEDRWITDNCYKNRYAEAHKKYPSKNYEHTKVADQFEVFTDKGAAAWNKDILRHARVPGLFNLHDNLKWYKVKIRTGPSIFQTFDIRCPPLNSDELKATKEVVKHRHPFLTPFYHSIVLWGHSITNTRFFVLEGRKRWLYGGWTNNWIPRYETVYVCIDEKGYNKRHDVLFNCGICQNSGNKY